MTMMYGRPAFAGAGVTELNLSEIDAVAGGPAPAGAAIAIRAGAGGLAGGTAAYAAARSDGKVTVSEARTVLVAVVVGAAAGATNGILKVLDI
jgi:hypothetical protein